MERVVRRPRRTWTIIAVSVPALSLAGPLDNGAHAGSVIALGAMHMAVGAVLIPALRHTPRN